jgi:hypothetical protein
MKMKTKKGGVFAALTAVLFITAALVTSCPEPLNLIGFTPPKVEEQASSVSPEGNTILQPPAGNTVSQPAEGKTVSQPEEGNTVSQPAEGNTVSQPAEGNTVSQPAEGNIVSQPPEEDTDLLPPEKVGYLYLNISIPESEARTIMPDTTGVTSLASFNSFDVYVLEDDGTTVVTSKTGILQSAVATAIPLAPGEYVVRVFGNVTANGGAVAVGEDDVEIEESAGATATIVLKEIVDGKGNGTFAWDLTPATTTPATAVSMTITGLSSGATASTEVGALTLSSGKYTGTTSLKSGYYRVEIEQTRDDHKTVKTLSILHVYQNFTSTFDTFTLPDLKLNVYTVTFSLNSVAGTPPSSQTINHGDRASKPVDPVHPTPTAVSFGGWCYDTAGTIPFGFNDTETTGTFVSDDPIIRTLTVYANWLPIYTVTFNYNDGDPHSTGVTAYDTKSVVSGEKVTAPTTNPTHRGNSSINTFDFWSATNNGTAFNFDTAIAANTTLYAIWNTLSTQDLEVDVTNLTFTAPVEPALTATANVNQIDGVSITVTLTNAGSFGSYSWYVDGYAAATGTANAALTFSTTELANKIVGDYIIYVEAYVGATPYSGQIKVSVTLKTP